MKKLLFTAAVAFGFTSALLAQVPNYVPTNGLVGWWPFNGNANDESGNGNNGTVNGATLTTDRFGNVNEAYSFDGVDDEIIVPDNQSLNFGTNPNFSINIWIKKALINSNGVFSKAQPYNGFGWNGWNYFNDDFQTGYPCLNNPIYVPVNNWTQITFTIENGVIKKYVNSIYEGEFQCINLINNSVSTNDNLHIGNARDLVDFFNGSIDELGIWNRSLTACEIANLYSAQLVTNSTTNISACNSYTWNGTTYTQSGQYTFLTTNANGCDSTANLNLTINNTSSSSQTQSALDSYTWPVNSQTYTQSGTYTATIPNAAGCDSILTLNLSLSYTGIDELSPNHGKTLVKITDLNGKETPFKKNTALLFIYEDGTVERVFEVE